MNSIAISDRRFDTPTRVCIEASLDTIIAHDLKDLEGEQYDYIDAVIEIRATHETVSFETVRTIEAWHRGEPSAGRGVTILPRSALAAIHI